MGGLVQGRALLLSKVESTYGSDASAAGADAVLITGFTPPNIEMETADRPKGDSSLAQAPHVVGARKWSAKFESYLKPHGTSATTAPECGPLLIGGGMAEDTATDVSYTPNSAYKGGISNYFYQDGRLYKMLGSVHDNEMSWETGGYFKLTTTASGLYVASTDAAFPGSLAFDAEEPDPILSAALTIGGDSPVVKAFSLKQGNVIAARKDANAATGYAGFLITGRMWEGSITVEDELVATKGYIAEALAGEKQVITFTVGTGTGSRTRVTCAAAILMAPTPGDDEGVATLEIPFRCYESALGADDEVQIDFL